MAKYVEKQQTFEAVQFMDASAKSDSLGIEVRTYDLDDGKRICSKCGQALSLHGVVDRETGWGTVCPGDWRIVHLDGTVEYLSEKLFNDRYQIVK